MGPAHSMIVNKTHKKLCVITFNNADLLYTSYHDMFIIEPGESKEVQAASDPIGLKIAVIYDAVPEGQIYHYQRWQCKNSSVLTVTYIDGGNISTYGDDTTSQGKGKIKESKDENFAKAIEALTYQAPVTRAAVKK
mmetsp:Transcript_1349/g.1433  ORF Transcript_1349/g.1433 Transcript_1349/m.1433 type:complete len:136 (+) Transcript_1349:136-543(+)|eukprot:gene1760-1873_t